MATPTHVILQLTEQQFYDIINILGMAAANVSFFAIQDLKRQGDPQAAALANIRQAQAAKTPESKEKPKVRVKAGTSKKAKA